MLGAIKYDHVVFHLAFALLGRFKSPLDGTIFQLFFSLRPALHAEENHLFLALLLNILAGENRSDPSLNELGSKLLLFRTRKVCDLALLDIITGILFVVGFCNRLNNHVVTETPLSTALVLLDKADG